jgi:hypothetical protein
MSLTLNLVETEPLLERLLAGARTAGKTGLMVFDLDSTLLDNRPRQARIMRELGEQRGIPALQHCAPEHWEGWDMRVAMRNAGVSADQIEPLYDDAREFWKHRFFTSEYCVDDVPVQGAVDFVAQVLGSGVVLAYVTGRHEAMREGTVGCFRRHGFPVPPGSDDRVHLLMKPELSLHDDVYKLDVQARLRTIGQLLAVFDNEPTHANGYRSAFPEATVVHLATDHSGRPVALLDGIVSIPHFGR